jgi:Flp pilus assembly protein TadG
MQRILRSKKRRGTRGAVLVEFLVATTPLLMTFFGLMQLGKIMTAQIAFHHAANVAVRAAAVIVDNDVNPGASGKLDEVKMAAQLALGDFIRTVTVNAATVSGGTTPNGDLKVTLTGTYNCNVPLGKTLVCGFSGKHTFKPVESTLPLFGARYKLK